MAIVSDWVLTSNLPEIRTQKFDENLMMQQKPYKTANTRVNFRRPNLSARGPRTRLTVPSCIVEHLNLATSSLERFINSEIII